MAHPLYGLGPQRWVQVPTQLLMPLGIVPVSSVSSLQNRDYFTYVVMQCGAMMRHVYKLSAK